MLKGFMFFLNYFSEKEGFLDRLYNKECIKKNE